MRICKPYSVLFTLWLITHCLSLKGQSELNTGLNLSSVGSQALEQFLIDHLKNKKVAYCQNTGNAGDALIWYGTICLFKKLGIFHTPYHLEKIVNTPSKAIDVIVFGGGGNFVPYYHHCSMFIKKVMRKEKPVIILPQTIQGHQRLLRRLLPNVTLFCREQMSYEYCLDNVPYQDNVLLACDLAFFADLTPFTMPRKEKNDPLTHLYAFRLDCEINKLREGIPLPRDNQDISLYGTITETTSYAENYAVVEKFIKTIDAYDVVWTDRLHVGIAAFLLGKKVHLFDNSYGKVRAVFEATLKSLDQHHQVVFHADWEIVSQISEENKS